MVWLTSAFGKGITTVTCAGMSVPNSNNYINVFLMVIKIIIIIIIHLC